MEVRCPVRSEGPWSPLGYRVVEVEAPDQEEKDALEEQSCRWLDEGPEDAPPGPEPERLEVTPEPPPRRRRLAWGVVGVWAACLVAAAVALPFVLPSRPSPAPPQQTASETPRLAGPAAALWADMVVKGPEARENFCTAIEFVRSPAVASRLAAEEGKLTFLLHVSGNFEEARFT
jgi:hypothetical protein